MSRYIYIHTVDTFVLLTFHDFTKDAAVVYIYVDEVQAFVHSEHIILAEQWMSLPD